MYNLSQWQGNTVRSESHCALRLWYVDFDVNIEVAVKCVVVVM